MTLLPIPKGVILSGRLCIIHSLCKEDTLDTNNITVPISLYEYLSPLAPSLPRRRRSLLVRVRWEDVPFPLRISLGTCLVRASSAGERERGEEDYDGSVLANFGNTFPTCRALCCLGKQAHVIS